MIRINFNKDWTVARLESGLLGSQIAGYPKGRKVDLPHDAMIEEQRDPDCPNQTRSGFYPGGYYRYAKRFQVPQEWSRKTVRAEFEGVYKDALVYLNGEYIGENKSGYSNFYVKLDQNLLYGEENELEVLVNNLGEAGSRWYSGSGIYRDVVLHMGDLLHIREDGVKIQTPDIEEDLAVVLVEIALENLENRSRSVTVLTELLDEAGEVKAEEESILTVYALQSDVVRQRITMADPALWSCENPQLYTCRVTMKEDGEVIDSAQCRFGIRKLQLDAVHGLRINGKEVKLRGACIHHDNGIIGARTIAGAEERRIRLLKEAGFNCIRSAHHPAGKALLDACDRLGMLVMDELIDMWHHPKEFFDHAADFEQNWESDVIRMINKDYNHPSVILYSTGNEIQEVGTPKGAQVNRRIAEKFHELDAYRYVTNGFNGLLASLDYKMEISRDIMEKGRKENKGLNDIMGEDPDLFDADVQKTAYAHPIMSKKIDAFMGPLDIAGYNYITMRYEMDRLRKPNRIILGSETFPRDIGKLWGLVKRNPYIIGDMTWTGYDYLGEAGLGKIRFEEDEDPNAEKDRIACSGDISMIGIRQPVSYYCEIVYGLRKEPYIAVENPKHYGMQPKKSAWSFEDSISSWTWRGYEGKKAVVDVYSDADEVELFINHVSQGRKPVGEANDYTAKFEVIYEAGEIRAVAYRNGAADGEYRIETAEEEVKLAAQSDRLTLDADTLDAEYITVSLQDASGRVNPQAVREISVRVEGCGYLLGFGNADPNMKGSYQDTTKETYQGYVQAAVRCDGTAGMITVIFATDKGEECRVELEAVTR